MKQDFQTAISNLNLLEHLKSFDPVVIGTPPLGIAIENSDIDIACYAKDLISYKAYIEVTLGQYDQFMIKQYDLDGEPTILTSFFAQGWEFEIFCQSIPTKDQWGVRHFYVEQKLLSQDLTLANKVIQLKRQGIKTEPAFAQILGLKGNPYIAILNLEELSDTELRALIS